MVNITPAAPGQAHHALHTSRRGHHIVLSKPLCTRWRWRGRCTGREHLLHPVHDGLDAHHVQEGFLLAGKRGVGEVFGRGGRAHGKRWRAWVARRWEFGKFMAMAFCRSAGKGCQLRPWRESRHRRRRARTSSVSSALELGADRRPGRRRPGIAERVGGGGEAQAPHALRQLRSFRRGWRFYRQRPRHRSFVRFSNGTTRAVGSKRADMGKLQLKPGLRAARHGGVAAMHRLQLCRLVVGRRCAWWNLE